ncbi:uncharacterized protein [Physcomitrium patens]|uniref:Uncharacterized protein n=1 Tax=Physcomitrium patens TaxID=3218 RepID=A0A2K1II34_PHYPA|nr:uncharacterized protein LOC112275739 [Physcomitrium patens]XP_024362119.1 uncharacterized protein LOC112275739 [Physcomitrium patens]XP_024362120.1 uncharacterized protein LOC112275739 [Physcomitrium patens]PNR28933.1 hypothetical protein PHYPA_027625 [Physcomitrium patens]|eukprot:XP_024362118.1 uncharacterized protein LOC112275739 [Physcomitrella patens]
MLRHESCKGRVFAKLVLTFLWLGCSQAAILLRGHDLALLVKVPSNPPLPVVRVALAQDNGTIDADNRGLSGRAVAGIAVGSALGGILVASIVMLSCCLRGIKKNSFNRENPSSTSETKTPIISGLNLFRMRNAPPNGYAVPPPISGVDKQDRDDISDTSFVLPELGGPNPHNKFDGMEWVDIKGLDDETLQDISTDLRKLQQLG